MYKLMSLLIVLLVACSLSSCTQKAKSENATDAIQKAKTLPTAEEQAKYLISEAKGFVTSEKYDEAISAAKYVVSDLQVMTQDAQKIIEQAMADMQKASTAKVESAKKKRSRNANALNNK